MAKRKNESGKMNMTEKVSDGKRYRQREKERERERERNRMRKR